MSFPAILRAPGLADRYAHLRVAVDRAQIVAPSVPKKNKRDDKEGRRWIRRKENARFADNVHIVLPSKRDYAITSPNKQPTFPHPLPHYLLRNNAIPAAVPAITEPSSANAGRFSMSLKGMRRELRKSGPRTELLVKEVEGEIVSWLKDGGVMLSPDAAAEVCFPGISVGSTEAIKEVSRTPLQLVWWIADDAFTRYVVHCCARYHDVVSFSKDISGQRLTYLLRPNVTRPDYHALASLDTPPVTDLSEASLSDFDTESDILSDRDYRSDTEAVPGARVSHLRAIEEASAPSTPSPAVVSLPAAQISDDEWSLIADAEADGEDSEAEQNISAAMRNTFLGDIDRTPRAEPRMASLRSPMWERQRRAASSPSRSPARRMLTRARRVEPPLTQSDRSFYAYLFS